MVNKTYEIIDFIQLGCQFIYLTNIISPKQYSLLSMPTLHSIMSYLAITFYVIVCDSNYTFKWRFSPRCTWGCSTNGVLNKLSDTK